MVPVVEASFNLCPVLPVNGLLEDKTKVHVAGVPLSSVIDCRLVVPFGCDDVVVVVWKAKAQLVLLPVWRVNEANSSCVYIGSSSPAWKRGSPLAPVVGEGQVNLGVRPWLVSGPWSKSPKLCG